MSASARDAVLASIARAQTTGRGTTAEPEPPAGYRMALDEDADAVDLLVDRLLDYRAEVRDVRGGGVGAVAAAVAEILRARGISRAVVPSGLPAAWRPEGVELVEDAGFRAAELDAFPAAITASAASVATTGTILLDHGPDQGRRAVSLVPDVHVCLVDAAAIHGELPGAIRALGPRAVMTWISGPSATSDIELVRVEGVHGPRSLVVVIHDGA